MESNSKKIFSERKTTGLTWYQVAFEWEDEYSKILNLEIAEMSAPYTEDTKKTICGEAANILRPFRIKKDNWNIAQVMYPRLSYRYRKLSVIPIYLDVPKKWVKKIIWETRKLPIYFVTCYDAYEMIKGMGKENCSYLPLSIPDRCHEKIVPTKEFDVIQIGRKNSVLHEYMMKYCACHPNVEYVYRDNGGYRSTIRGLIGEAVTREDYMNLLKKAKISLVSTPAVDGEKDFGGFDFFTPRFFESVACYCHLIGRYTDNSEAGFFNMKSICKNIITYDMFEKCIEEKLAISCLENLSNYTQFINTNLTSARAEKVKDELRNAGILI